MTGPLEFVEAAHKQAEETAQAARECEFLKCGRWQAQGPYCDNRYGILVSDEGEHITGDGDFPWPFVAHMALHDPAAVLRRIAAERKILDKHRATRTAGYDAYGAAVIDTCITCGSQYAPYPCATVRLLAEGWGWQEEQHG